MSICAKCKNQVDHVDEKTLCDPCVAVILENVSLDDTVDIVKEVMRRVFLNEARWKAKGAGFR